MVTAALLVERYEVFEAWAVHHQPSLGDCFSGLKSSVALVVVGCFVFHKLCNSSVQFKMISMRSEKPICITPHLSEVSPKSPLKRFQRSSD